MSARQRACRQPCPGPPGHDDFLNSGNCENSTVSTTTAPGTCKPAQQGHRSPCPRTAAGESRWSKPSGPWDKPLRHDREICTTCKQGRRPPCTATGENLWSDELSGPWDKLCATTVVKTTTDELQLRNWNLHDCIPGTPTTQHKLQMRNLYGPPLDHGNRPLHNEGNVDDHQ